MRIEGPRGPDSVRKNEKTRKSGDVSSDFKSFLETETEGAADVGAAPAMGGVGALIAAQASEDPTERKARKRMKDRAGRVLDALSQIHRGMVGGGIAAGDMEAVSRAVSEQREKVADPVLAGLLDEVELRAQVELAKLELARDKKS